MEFVLDDREVKRLRQWYPKQPRLIQESVADMLNHFAFGTRTQAIAQIGKTMVVRNARFVASRIQVTKARSNQAVTSQRSRTGSVAVPRFSGWVEQETGKTTERKRFATMAGRGGDIKKQIRPSVRLKPKAEVITPGTAGYTPRGGKKNISGFIAMVLRNKENRLVRIGRNILKRRPGQIMYQAKKTQLQLVQRLKKKQPRQIHWLRDARAAYFRGVNLDALWKKTVDRRIKAP